ncbi:hypothetical protein [Gordonia polyisoprenivorans]|uniref:hypothetical protein n=1 Tax=Gordonia polyisoprenivorans TaxID=84595 RepID=UPI002300E0A8|nr:hypothetical protein [Gordonia polyisoprenivorans]WCB35579.1 hypothetical protein PHA63_15815 [Gordonia polyisoprenivorans]
MIFLNALTNSMHELGIEVKHPKAVTAALTNYNKLIEFTSQELPNVAELAAGGNVKAACDAITLTTQVDTLRFNGSITLAEEAITTAVLSNADGYLRQCADVVTGHALEIERTIANMPTTRKDWMDFEVASRSGYGSDLGRVLDSANSLVTYARRIVGTLLVPHKDRSGRITSVACALFEPVEDLVFTEAAHAQHNLDTAITLHQTATAEGVIRVAESKFEPVTLSPVTTAEGFSERQVLWRRAIGFAQSANAVKEFERERA